MRLAAKHPADLTVGADDQCLHSFLFPGVNCFSIILPL
jgi:hypothetical protein